MQAQVLENWLNSLKADFANGFIDISPAIAERWGHLHSLSSLPEIEGLIAAIALDRDLTLVTRNVADFAGSGLRILNPLN